MFGLSASKIVLIVVVIGAIVYGSRLLRALSRPEPSDRRDHAGDREAAGSTVLERCERCGAYADLSTHRCTAEGRDRATRGPG